MLSIVDGHICRSTIPRELIVAADVMTGMLYGQGSTFMFAHLTSYVNVPQCYVIRTFPILSVILVMLFSIVIVTDILSHAEGIL